MAYIYFFLIFQKGIKMKISFSEKTLPTKGVVVLTLNDELKLNNLGAKIDQELGGTLSRAIEIKKFKAKKGEYITILAPNGGEKLDAVIIIGLGKEKKLNNLDLQIIGSKIISALIEQKLSTATIMVEQNDEMVANFALGAALRSYRFDKYKTKKDDKKITIESINFATADSKKAKKHFDELEAVSRGTFFARNVVSEPPNKLYPESYANIIKEQLEPLGVKVKILGIKEMTKLGLGALLGVGQGSARESRLVALEYCGKKNDKNFPLALVGKGVTFDTGGISIKPAQGMEDMKYDMGGSAAVVGTIYALAARGAKVNVVGVVGLVENMPGGNAQRPSDIVTSMSGQTIEVLNTDAEGRLVLSDALWYTQENYSPKYIVDLATLTGAIVIALGSEYAGLFSNDDEFSQNLSKAGDATGEKLWRFPLSSKYDKMIDSPVADMQNISSGRGAGSITAAQFLQRFIKKDTKWAHLDIAGTAWTKENIDLCPTGATGFGVRLLDNYIRNNLESK